MLYQAFRRLYLLAGKHALEFESIYSRLSTRMVIGNDKSFFCLLSHFGYVGFYPLQAFPFVKKVITLVAVLALKPLLIIAPMQTDICKGSGHVHGAVQAVAETRLVHVAESNTLFL